MSHGSERAMSVSKSLFQDIHARGMVIQSTPMLEEHLLAESRTLYCGFDPTADSLHIGHLVPLIALRRFQLAGHSPIALVGGATGLVGDPSFKAAERSLNTSETVGAWTDSITSQVQRFLDGEGACKARIVNNLDWFKEFRLLDFLREVGKSFSVSTMINKDSVRQRIEREGEGISFAEFSYMLLQAYDFAELNRRYGCTLQIGGSDQWGNITGGIDLCRRQNRSAVHALTFPLVTKADGAKFGKTEAGTVWLDPSRTSPYAFYQFWINTHDADVYRFLNLFTFLDPEEVKGIREKDAVAGGKPSAQSVLAEEVTRLVHGQSGLMSAVRISDALFAGTHVDLSEDDFRQLLLDGIPASRLDEQDLRKPLTTLLADTDMVSSGKQVKDALMRRSLQINGESCGIEDNMQAAIRLAPERAMFGRYFLARLGKKSYHLFWLQ